VTGEFVEDSINHTVVLQYELNDGDAPADLAKGCC
jgi:hypothetical protein